MDVQNQNINKENNSQNLPANNTAENNKLMSVLAYVGPLVIISYIAAKNSPAVKFHIKQGLVLFTIEIVVWIVGMIISSLWPITCLINLAVMILSIIGIVRVIQGKELPLPLVGKYASHFNNI